MSLKRKTLVKLTSLRSCYYKKKFKKKVPAVSTGAVTEQYRLIKETKYIEIFCLMDIRLIKPVLVLDTSLRQFISA